MKNKLLGKDIFWITSDGDGEYSLSNFECMFYNYCSPIEMLNFLTQKGIGTLKI